MNNIDDRHKHIAAANTNANANVEAKPKSKRLINSDPNSVCYFLDLVNRIDSLQLAVAQERAESQRLREQVRAFLQRGYW